MKSGLSLLCVTLLTEGLGSLTRVAAGTVSNDLIVETKLGKIQGFETATSDNKKVSAWYGVPYAQPPVGNLRFRHPRPRSKARTASTSTLWYLGRIPRTLRSSFGFMEADSGLERQLWSYTTCVLW